MVAIQREIYVLWYNRSEMICSELNRNVITWEIAVIEMRKLLEKLNKLEEAKARIHGNQQDSNYRVS